MKTVILFGCFVYFVFGIIATMYPGITTTNIIKRTGIALIWPFFLIVGVVKILIWLGKRFRRDFQELLPKHIKINIPNNKINIPNKVTVAMLSEDKVPNQYQIHSWMSD